jgi:hypothetical protein
MVLLMLAATFSATAPPRSTERSVTTGSSMRPFAVW